jgi:isoquinoline 1-oxidoreductase subunit beta
VKIGKVDRRTLLALAGATTAAGAAGATGIALGVYQGRRWEHWAKRVPPRPEPLSPSVFWALDPEGALSVWVPRSEMGQGVLTSLPLLVAEELDVPWERVRPIRAIANPNFGFMLTAVSKSIRVLFTELRQAGARGRVMLIQAAAEAWREDPSRCTTEPGFVVHRPSGRRAAYADLAEAAGRLAIPDEVPLKRPQEFRLIGASPPRLDIPDKLTGAAEFGADVKLPGMRYASVRHFPPEQIPQLDLAEVRAIPGVLGVEVFDFGLAVVGEHTWAVLKGADVLPQADTDFPDAETQDARLREAFERPGLTAESEPKDAPFPDLGPPTVQAEYRLPYLPHLVMEPPNATAWVEPNRCRIWAPTQSPRGVHFSIADALGLERSQVEVQPTLLGTGFGRRADKREVQQAVQISQRIGRPVHVIWSRSEDIRNDGYRPVNLHRMEGWLDGDGALKGWRHRVASPSILAQDPAFEGLDGLVVEGAIERPYAAQHSEVRWHPPLEMNLRLGFWRSVGHSYNAFAVECFVDELAAAAGEDPARFRLARTNGRHAEVLKTLVEASDWDAPLPENRARGMAVHGSFGSVVGYCVEVSLPAVASADPGEAPALDGLRVERVVCAVDCGLAVHPDGVRAQIEGAVAFALSAALYGDLPVKEGRIRPSNFHDAPVLRFDEMPDVEVHISNRPDAPPGGVGEIGVPPLFPALANAVTRLTGHRPRRLPLLARVD